MCAQLHPLPEVSCNEAAEVPVDDEVNEDDLMYTITPENVCLEEGLIFEMNDASELMATLGFASRMPQPVRQSAMVAAELMGESGPLQEHGLVCVHKSCVTDFHRMYSELQRFLDPLSDTERAVNLTLPLDVYMEAIHMVLTLGYRFLQETHQRRYVRAHLDTLEAMLPGPVLFDFGEDDHMCVPLFTRGTVDPDGEPNVYG